MLFNKALSGWQDSNLRPPGPKPGAIPGYATSRTKKIINLLILLKMKQCYWETVDKKDKNFCGEGGIRTHGTVLPVRRFSKPFLSATQAPLLPALFY